jgi:hypothetical protein
MTLPGLLIRLFVSHKPEVLADKVATRSRQAIWNRVSHRIHQLAGAEARGYVRARAAAIIEAETDLLIAEEGGKVARYRDQIIQVAGDSVIRLVLEQSQLSRQSSQLRRRAA